MHDGVVMMSSEVGLGRETDGGGAFHCASSSLLMYCFIITIC